MATHQPTPITAEKSRSAKGMHSSRVVVCCGAAQNFGGVRDHNNNNNNSDNMDGACDDT